MEGNNMWSMFFPILLIVLTNVFYNIATKSTPNDVNFFVSLTITYSVAAIICFVSFMLTSGSRNILVEFHKTNWASFVLGIVIVGLELGYLLAYRNGWKMNRVSVTANIILAVVLVFVSAIAYKETITVKQIVGIILCAGGLCLVNL